MRETPERRPIAIHGRGMAFEHVTIGQPNRDVGALTEPVQSFFAVGRVNAAYYLGRLAAFERESRELAQDIGKGIAFVGDGAVEHFDLGGHFSEGAIHNRGITADHIDHASGLACLHRLEPTHLVAEPSTILLHIGRSELAEGIGVRATVARTSGLLDAIHARWPRTRIVCNSLIPPEDAFAHLVSLTVAFNEGLQRLATRHDALFIDVHKVLVGRTGIIRPRYSAGAGYLSRRGEAAWADLLANTLGLRTKAAPSGRVERTPLFAASLSMRSTTATPDPRPDPKLPLDAGRYVPVHRLFHAQAHLSPRAAAVIDCDGESVSYAELSAEANALTEELVGRGVRKGDVVAIWADRSASLVWALFGVLGAGAAFTVLDSSYPPARLTAALAIARPTALVALESAGPVPDELTRTLDGIGCRICLSLESIPYSHESVKAPGHTPIRVSEVEGDDVAYVAFTSGTTGKPKAIVGTHAPISHFVDWHVRTFGFGASDRFAMLSGLAHDPLLRDIFTPLVSGGALVLPPVGAMRDPVVLRARLAEEGVTAVHLTPSLGELLAHGRDRDMAYRTLPALKWCFFGGESLKRVAVERFMALAPNATCVNFYGATETPQAIAYWVIGRTDTTSDMTPVVSVGRGIAGVQLLILRADGRHAEVGESGEIHVRTRYLARGYLDDDVLTTSRFVADPFGTSPSDRLYKTGDLGRYCPDGTVEALGRGDRQVKIRGYRVELDDIEATLSLHPSVRQVAVSLVEADGVAARIVAYVAAPQSVNGQLLRTFLRDRLPDYMVPSEIVTLPALFLTATGKVDREMLATTTQGHTGFLEASGPDVESNAFLDEAEHKMATIWSEVLRVPVIGRDDTFFDLGGNSLSGLELLLRVEDEFQKRLPVNSLLLAPSVARMCALLRDGAPTPRVSLLVPIREGGSRPPVYWLPGGGGLSVLLFRSISHRLGAGQPVYGLEADLDVTRAPTTLPEIVRAYMEEIRNHQPQGPYYLLGFSLGSFVAYELGVQLRAAGQEVGLLGVFDTQVPNSLRRQDYLRIAVQRARYRISAIRHSEQGWSAALASWLSFQAKIHNVHWSQIKMPVPKTSEQTVFDTIIARNIAAVREYAAKPLPRYDGKVTCFLARSTSMHGVDPNLDPRLGWRKFADGGVEAHYVPGDHLLMLEPPHVDELAATLRKCLRTAQGPSARRKR